MNYPERLSEAWKEHLAPRAPDALTVVSLFAGCGGSSLGYSMAGFRECLAVEWDKHACETFRTNFSDVPIYEGDIGALTDAEALRLAGLHLEQLDVLDGSPPCQGFSMAGKRAKTDGRNRLFEQFVRLLCAFKPRAFVMENVTGLVKGGMGQVFAEIHRALTGCGYRVKARVLNASWYGVPQNRQRVIFIGAREDLGLEPEHPKTETRAVTVQEAWTDVPPGQSRTLQTQYLAVWHRIKQGQSAGDVMGTGGQSCVKVKLDSPCVTIPKVIGGPGYGSLVHPHEPRECSISELKRIQSFPDAFVLEGDYCECRARIGNSVPPLLMRAIARQVADTLSRSQGIDAGLGALEA